MLLEHLLYTGLGRGRDGTRHMAQTLVPQQRSRAIDFQILTNLASWYKSHFIMVYNFFKYIVGFDLLMFC